jgi:hypothetical protein
LAALTFTVLQTEVYDQCGLDSGDANNAIRVKRWLNLVQQDIFGRWPWNFARGRETIYTVPDYTTGTVSISNGSTSLAGSSTVWAAVGSAVQYAVNFSNSNDWYFVSTINSNTSITLSTAFQGTNLSGATYILRKFLYSMSSSCDRIAEIKNWATPLKLDELFLRDVDLKDPNAKSTNISYSYIPYGYDASGNVQIIPYPFPSDTRLLEIKTFIRPTDMVNTTDLPSLPNKWAHIIAFGAVAIGFMYLRKIDVAETWQNYFEKKLLDMKHQERLSEDSSPVLASIDSGNKTENWLQLPRNYPVVPGRP